MQTHHYRCHLIPTGYPEELLELAADRGSLPTHQMQAPNAEWAEATAQRATGLRVARTERIEGEAPQLAHTPQLSSAAMALLPERLKTCPAYAQQLAGIKTPRRVTEDWHAVQQAVQHAQLRGI